jgi:hypothetical protein
MVGKFRSYWLVSTLFGALVTMGTSWSATPGKPSPATGNGLGIEASGFRRDLRSGQLVQVLKVTNKRDRSLRGAFHVVLEGLDPQITVQASGPASGVAGSGIRSYLLASTADGAAWKPGEVRTLRLNFSRATTAYRFGCRSAVDRGAAATERHGIPGRA